MHLLEDAKYLKLKGKLGDSNQDRQIAKQPVNKWQDSKNQYSYNTKNKIIDKGHWIGMIIPTGTICLDIDTPEGLDYFRTHLDLFPCYQKTRNGIHAYFLDPGDITGATHQVSAEFRITFRASERNYVVVEPSDGYSWGALGELTTIPELLRPKKSTETTQLKPRKTTNKPSKDRPEESGKEKFDSSILETVQLLPELASGFYPVTHRIANQIRNKSIEHHKHETRLAAGWAAGDYRLPAQDVDYLSSVCMSVSKTPEAAKKTFYSGYFYALVKHAQKFWEEKDPEKLLISYFLEQGEVARNITAQTSRKAGISNRALGLSQQRRVGGRNTRVHAVPENIFQAAYQKIRDQRKAETLRSDKNRIEAAQIASGIDAISSLEECSNESSESLREESSDVLDAEIRSGPRDEVGKLLQICWG